MKEELYLVALVVKQPTVINGMSVQLIFDTHYVSANSSYAAHQIGLDKIEYLELSDYLDVRVSEVFPSNHMSLRSTVGLGIQLLSDVSLEGEPIDLTNLNLTQ